MLKKEIPGRKRTKSCGTINKLIVRRRKRRTSRGGVCTAYIRDLSLYIPAKPTEILSKVDKLTVTVQENNRKLSYTRRQHNQLELLLRLDPHANRLQLASAV